MPDGVEVLKEFSLQPWEDPTPSIPYVRHLLAMYGPNSPSVIYLFIIQPNSCLLGQCTVDKIMRAELSKYGCEVELGVELQTFTQLDDHVEVTLLKHSLDGGDVTPGTEKASYDWVIGADGARGAVRQVLGLKFIGETTTQKFVVGDVEFDGPRLETDVSSSIFSRFRYKSLTFLIRYGICGETCPPYCKFLIFTASLTYNKPNNRASLRSTEDKGIFNFIFGGAEMTSPEEICQSHENVIKTLKRYSGLGDDVKFGKLTWVSPFR